MKKKLIFGLLTLGAVAVMIPLFAAFEAHVINVTAQIENALRVHAAAIDFGTVFPQELILGGFSVETSDSFSATTQQRVKKIDYVVKQKPKPRVDTPENAEFCHNNTPANPGDPNDPYYDTCYPILCSYLSKHPQVSEPGDVGVDAFHDWKTVFGTGHLDKTLGIDLSDQWVVDLDVPCFAGQCAQDWTHQGWELPAGLEGQVFGCDLWVEVTSIY